MSTTAFERSAIVPFGFAMAVTMWGAAYLLRLQKDPQLEAQLDQIIAVIAAAQEPDIIEPALAYALAVAVGATAYTLAFMALSTITSRALAVGLGYILIWEGIMAGLLPGTQTFSVRQATLGLADMLGATEVDDPLDPATSVAILGIVIVGSLLLSGWRMSRYQLRGGD